jgi:hypothetical protein
LYNVNNQLEDVDYIVKYLNKKGYITNFVEKDYYDWMTLKVEWV